VQQSDLFEQYARVLGTLAHQSTLLLVVDDLQWADAGSISLLFHLGRGLAGSRILIMGAYRPEEVALGRSGERHPLEPVVNEFKRSFGDIEVDLAQARGRQFVDDFLDTDANRLGTEFREMLYRQTGGHALFTVELLRGMQERGDLVRDGAERWVEGSVLDWERLPARVEAVIAERIGRLPAEWQATLAVASVEGEKFTAEAVARVQAADEEALVRHLSGELSKRHRLVIAQSLQRRDGQRLSRYRFRHYLFQKYLYKSLDEVERAHLHEAMGKALETLYGESAAEIAVQLARHFQAAGLVPKAVDYLIQAGNKAVRLSANEEAIAHFRQGLALLETLPDSGGEGGQSTPEHRLERAQQELALQMSMGAPLVATQGYGAPEVERAFGRARELCWQVGETPQLGPAVWGLKAFYHLRAQYQTALELAEQCLDIAQRTDDSALLVGAHMSMGTTLTHLGKFAPARAHYEQGIAHYDPQQHRSLAFRYGHDPKVGCLSYGAAGALWHLGYPDQALKWSHEALALAQELDHPHTLAYALHFAALLHICRREVQAARERAEADIALCTEQGFPLWLGATTIYRGWAMVKQGQGGEWISQMRQGMTTFEATGGKVARPINLCLLADAYAKTGQPGEGLKVLDEALDAVNDTGEGWWETELHRLRGELLRARQVQAGGKAEVKVEIEAEACFRQAIEVARRQEAKSWELRAAMSLSRLLQKQGKQEEAWQLLAEIYDWFTEGFGTADLQEAKALLEKLS
jgi:predicted ATPase